MKNKGKVKFYSFLGLSPVILSGFVPLFSCGEKPTPTECSISVSNLTCDLSQTTVKAKEALDLIITNKQVDEWDITDVTSVRVGSKELMKGSEYIVDDDIGIDHIILHFGTNIIVNNVVIELTIVEHGHTDDYKISLSAGVEGSKKSIPKDTDLEMTIKPLHDEKLIDHINKVLVNNVETTHYEFNSETSTFTMEAKYINGDIQIDVALIDHYHKVNLTFDEGQEGYVKISNTQAEHGVEYKTNVEIVPGHTYDYAFKNVVINIGDEEQPLDPEHYNLNIDTNFSYKATLTINKEFVINKINLKFELKEKELNTCFVYYTDGVSTVKSNILFFDQYGFQEQISMPDTTKTPTKIVVYSRDSSGKKTKLDPKDYLIDGGTVTIYPTAHKDEDFLVDVFATCKEGTNFSNDTWDNIIYYTSLGWEHFAYMYPVNGEQVNPDYVGLVRDLKIKSLTYQVRVIGQKFNNLVDQTTPEGKTALLTFEFVQVYCQNNGDDVALHFGEPQKKGESIHKVWYRRSDPQNWESNVYKCLNTNNYDDSGSGQPSFYSVIPDWLKNGVRPVANWHIEGIAEGEGENYFYQKVSDKFFILNPVQINVLGGNYEEGVPTKLAYSNVVYPWYNVTGQTLINRRHKFDFLKNGKQHSYWLSGPNWKPYAGSASYVNNGGTKLETDGVTEGTGGPRCVVPVFCL